MEIKLAQLVNGVYVPVDFATVALTGNFSDLKGAPKIPTYKNIFTTSTSMTVGQKHAMGLIRVTGNANVTITVGKDTLTDHVDPLESIAILQDGTGTVTIAPATTDVVIKTLGGKLKLAGQNAIAVLIKLDNNEYKLSGETTK